MKPAPITVTARTIVLLLVAIVGVPLLPMLISGDWGWPEAWAYAVLNVGTFLVGRALAARRHPDILAERVRFMDHANTQPWDKALAPILVLSGVLSLVVAGLDHRFGWSPAFGPAARIAALAAIAAGYVFASWALIENRFFSGVVRLQTERGHHLITGGPYRWIRHPGYAGALLAYVVTPVLLDSLWAFAPVVLNIAVVVIRTRLEDRFLRGALDGYEGYAQRVRFRLIPGIW